MRRNEGKLTATQTLTAPFRPRAQHCAVVGNTFWSRLSAAAAAMSMNPALIQEKSPRRRIRCLSWKPQRSDGSPDWDRWVRQAPGAFPPSMAANRLLQGWLPAITGACEQKLESSKLKGEYGDRVLG